MPSLRRQLICLSPEPKPRVGQGVTLMSVHGDCLLVFFLSLFVYVSLVFSSPEPSGSQGVLIVYPCSGVHCRRESWVVNNFKHLILRNRLAYLN